MPTLFPVSCFLFPVSRLLPVCLQFESRQLHPGPGCRLPVPQAPGASEVQPPVLSPGPSVGVTGCLPRPSFFWVLWAGRGESRERLGKQVRVCRGSGTDCAWAFVRDGGWEPGETRRTRSTNATRVRRATSAGRSDPGQVTRAGAFARTLLWVLSA